MRFLRLFGDLALLSRRAVRLERLRTSAGPREAVLEARRLGGRSYLRRPAERRLLRALIATVDRLWPSGPNCYRRVLLEVAMDSGAAEELVQMGFRKEGGVGSGHAGLGPGVVVDGKERPYDAIVSI